ncbi:MAG TPA: OmpW family outer membrane protein [Burkholderiaceae bacterium]|nr:OmpW family outer membrane protein [Burkholderiaceae bacterium]
MSKQPIRLLALAAALLAAAPGTQAQDQSVYIGGALIRIDSKAPPLAGPPGSTPPDARLDVDDARTLIFGYQRYFNDHWGLDLALGIPPKHKVYGRGALEGFGQIASSKQVAPTLFVNYRFGHAGDRLRPFVGLGVNYTHFTDTRSTTAGDWASGGPTKLKLKDSWGWAAQAGASYALTDRWTLNATVAVADVESDLTATTTTPGGGTIVRRTKIDFNPVVFTMSVGWRF